MVWHWLWILFHEWDKVFDIFASGKHEWKYEKTMSLEWNKFIQRQTIEYPVYYIFFVPCECFFQIYGTLCNTWRDNTIACYFHIVKISF